MGIQAVGQAIGTGLSSMAESMFLEATTVEGVTTYSLSVFGGILAIFAGISLAVGLCYLVYNWISSLGAKH